MPEGPWLHAWCQQAQQYCGQKIQKITGTIKIINKSACQGAYLSSVQVYGKHMFIQLSHSASGHRSLRSGEDKEHSIWLRYHFLMNGRLFVDEGKLPNGSKQFYPRLVLQFQKGKYLAFYGGSQMIVDGPCMDTGTDILTETFDKQKAIRMLRQPLPVCYTLLDQSHFSGVGNIIKNEALYESKIHPLEVGHNLSIAEAENVVDEVVKFSKKWTEWKMSEHGSKENFKDHMSIYFKFQCPLEHKTTRGWYGSTELKRVTIWCPQCQPLKREMAIHKELGYRGQGKASDGDVLVDNGQKNGGESGDETEDYDWHEMGSDMSSRGQLANKSIQEETLDKTANVVSDGDETEDYDLNDMSDASSARCLTQRSVKKKGATKTADMLSDVPSTRRLTRQSIQEENVVNTVEMDLDTSLTRRITRQSVQKDDGVTDAFSTRRFTRQSVREEILSDVSDAKCLTQHRNREGMTTKKAKMMLNTSTRCLTQKRNREGTVAKKVEMKSGVYPTRYLTQIRRNQRVHQGSKLNKFIISLAPRRKRKINVFQTTHNWNVLGYRFRGERLRKAVNKTIIETSSGKFVIS